jgi:hypothetical protein
MRERRERVSDAIGVLMAWRFARSRSHDSELLPEEQREARAEAEAALAELFLLTHGWFQGELTLRKMGVRLPGFSIADDTLRPQPGR